MGRKTISDHLIPAHFIDDETEKQEAQLHLILDYTSNLLKVVSQIPLSHP